MIVERHRSVHWDQGADAGFELDEICEIAWRREVGEVAADVM
jgi:hypothetical protein